MSTLTSKIVADFRTSLATELAIGGTTATLQSATDDDGVALPAGNYFFTIDGNNSQKEHFACTLSGTSLTAIKSVSRQGVQTSGSVRKHRIGASVVITDFAHIQVINDLVNGTTDLDASNPLSYDSTATINSANQLATKAYVDGVAISGAPDADTTTKGIVEIATGAELAAGTGTGGTGATVVAAGSSFKNTSAGEGDANKVPVLDAAGLLSDTFLPAVISKTADGIQITTDPDSANDAVRKSYFDAQVGLFLGSLEAGENITAGMGVYIKASDGKAYMVDADADESVYSFIGICATTVTTGNTCYFARPGGIVTGLAGLTAGAYYYITSTAGTLGTTPNSTRFAKVGQALSTTTMRVIEPKFSRRGTVTISATGDTSVTTGFYPARIEVRAGSNGASSATEIGSIGDDSNNCVFWTGANAGQSPSSFAATAWRCESMVNGTVYSDGTISAKSATGFTINCATFSTYSAQLQWVAISD